MRPIKITTTAPTDDLNGIAQDQTTAGADDLTLNGVLVSGGIAYCAGNTASTVAQGISVQGQRVSIESTGNLSGVTFTVTGKDVNLKDISESRAGPNNNTVLTTAHFSTVTGVSVNGAVGTNVEVGWEEANGFRTRSIVINSKERDFSVSLAVNISGTITYTVQHTSDSPFDTYSDSFAVNGHWVATTNLSGASADAEGSLTTPEL